MGLLSDHTPSHRVRDIKKRSSHHRKQNHEFLIGIPRSNEERDLAYGRQQCTPPAEK